jgi:transcriptional regulator with XRE-family HTH domain
MTDQSEVGAAAKRAIPVDSFAHRLMLARAHAGHLSIREAAERCGFGRGAWTNWEKGTVPLDLEYVAEVIAEKLGVDETWLVIGGGLAAERERSRRWSTVRPAHHTRTSPGSQATVAKLQAADRPMPAAVSASPGRGSAGRPRDNRPKGRAAGSVPNPATRRPVRLPAPQTRTSSAA